MKINTCSSLKQMATKVVVFFCEARMPIRPMKSFFSSDT